MDNNNNIGIRFNTNYLPLDYKLLEWRLILNRELYEEKVIELKIYSMVENSLLGRMEKIRNEIQEKNNNFDSLCNSTSLS